MATKRQVFYSFHYELDYWRVSQVRNIGAIEGNRPAADNDWEQIKKSGDGAIQRWIDRQMRHRSCTVVLVGEKTAGRKWINYEIIRSWKEGMGVVGIRIHRLQNQHKRPSLKGPNPFDHLGAGGRKFFSVVECYTPSGSSSEEIYAWISRHLSNVVERAIRIRDRYE